MYTGVRIRRAERVDAVREPQFFPHALKQARTHSATQKHAEQCKRITTRIAVRDGLPAKHDMGLRNICALDMNRLRRCGDCRRNNKRRHVS